MSEFLLWDQGNVQKWILIWKDIFLFLCWEKSNELEESCGNSGNQNCDFNKKKGNNVSKKLSGLEYTWKAGLIGCAENLGMMWKKKEVKDSTMIFVLIWGENRSSDLDKINLRLLPDIHIQLSGDRSLFGKPSFFCGIIWSCCMQFK